LTDSSSRTRRPENGDEESRRVADDDAADDGKKRGGIATGAKEGEVRGDEGTGRRDDESDAGGTKVDEEEEEEEEDKETEVTAETKGGEIENGDLEQRAVAVVNAADEDGEEDDAVASLVGATRRLPWPSVLPFFAPLAAPADDKNDDDDDDGAEHGKQAGLEASIESSASATRRRALVLSRDRPSGTAVAKDKDAGADRKGKRRFQANSGSFFAAPPLARSRPLLGDFGDGEAW